MEKSKKMTITFGDKVRIKKQGYEKVQGRVQFIGEMEGVKNTIFYGIELDKKIGKYDGSFLNKRYFECGTRKGLFVTMHEIEKLIRKSRSMPRVTVPSTVYVNKCECKGTLKYIGIPFVEKNKSRSIYYGIELEEAKGKNNGTIDNCRYFRCLPQRGIFVKKDGFEYVPNEQCIVTPGAPDNDDDSPRESRKFKYRGKGSQRQLDLPLKQLTLRRSKSNTANSTKRLKVKMNEASNRSRSRPNSPQPRSITHVTRSKSQQITRKKGKSAKFKRNVSKERKTRKPSTKKQSTHIVTVSKPNNSATNTLDADTKRGRSQTKGALRPKEPKLKRPKSATCTIRSKSVTINKNDKKKIAKKKHTTRNSFLSPKSIASDRESFSDAFDTETNESNEDEDILMEEEVEEKEDAAVNAEIERRNTLDETEAVDAITNTLSIRNYRLFIPRIEPVKCALAKLSKKGKKTIINDTQLQRHDNDLMIWQNILHLALFIVKAMHSFFTLEDKKKTWDFIDFLLQNGGDPLIQMTIKQDDIYEHKNVFRLMTEALKTYKQNELLIVKRFRWLWSLVTVGDTIATYAVNRPSLITFDNTFSNHWIIADAYDALPSPRILREYLNFGCDLVHLCGAGVSYYDFNHIRESLAPDAVISTVRIGEDMIFCMDMIGRIILYYKHYISLRTNDLISLYHELVEKKGFAAGVTADMMHTIVSYTVTDIVYLDPKIQEVDVLAQTVRRMPNYSRDWKEFLFKHILYKLSNKKKSALKAVTKTWDQDSEWDYFIANLKKKQQFMCCIDVFEHVIGYKTAQKITDYYIKKNNIAVIQQYMQNENAFKYLELYNLLFTYSLKRSACARYIFQRLVDLVLNHKKKSERRQSRSMARKELNNLYVQFCRHEVSDYMFQQNFLFILRQLLAANEDNMTAIALSPRSRKSKTKKPRKPYRFDFGQAILHCYKAGTLNTLVFLMDNALVLDVERTLRLFYVDDVIKRIIFGMDDFDETQEDFLKLILNWSWKHCQKKEDMQTWYVKWLQDAQSVHDQECIHIFEYYCNLNESDVSTPMTPYL